jgi:hypothetical protein
MRQFSDLSPHEQALLLVKVVQLVANGDSYISIEEVAAGRNNTSQQLWLKICSDEGMDDCEPWNGFPELPKYFPRRDGRPIEHPLSAKLRKQITHLAEFTDAL